VEVPVARGEDRTHGGLPAVRDETDLPPGAVVTASGRVSAAETFAEPDRSDQPFTPMQLTRLDEAMTLASRETGLHFSVYLGDPAGRSAAALHDELEDAERTVLVVVDPEGRTVEVVTGGQARVRLPDRGAKLAVMSMVASFREGDLLGGLLSGLRMLADQAGGRGRAS
jgi:hypothetical protein